MIGERFVTGSPAPLVALQPAAEPDVSVITVTYGTGRVVIDMLLSLAEAAADPSSPAIEAIVVDHPHPGAGDRTLTDLRLFTAGVRVVRPPDNLGFGGGCEVGALAARAGTLAFVNPDVEVPIGWLAPLVDALDEPGVSIAAPLLVDPDGALQEAGQRLDSTASTSPIRDAPSERATVDYASAACWVLRRSTHERLGGFDPLYHPAYFEDVDLALRTRRSGDRCVVVPEVRVMHHGGAGVPGLAAPASAQREVLRRQWPEIAWTQPRPT
ncbi:MAG: glycosyltransferase family 2 protein [Ilumatobacter sp.]|nr:glycosyltransferase family 2 protein [Ilumatobacter sp.]